MIFLDRYLKESRLMKDVSWSFISTSISSFLQFALIFVLIHSYSHEEFGLWGSITSIAAVIVTGDFGIVNVLRFIISRELLNKEDGDKNSRQYFYSALIFFLFFATLISVVLFILKDSIVFESLFKTDNNVLKQQGRAIFLIIQFVFLYNIPFSLGIPLFFSYGETKYYAIISIIRAVVAFLIVTVLSATNFSIVAVCIFYFISNTLITLLGTIYFIYRRKWYSFTFNIRDILRKNKEMISSGIKFLGVQMSGSFLSNVIIIYSGSMVGLSVTANISFIQKLYSFLGGIYQSIFNPLWGELAISYQRGMLKRCRNIINKSMLLTFAYFVVTTLILVLSRKWIILLIANNSFDFEYQLFILIGVLFLMKLLFDNVSLLHNAMNKMNVILISYLLMVGYVLIFVPPIIKCYGINIMIVSLIIVWALFVMYVYTKMLQLTKKCSHQN